MRRVLIYVVIAMLLLGVPVMVLPWLWPVSTWLRTGTPPPTDGPGIGPPAPPPGSPPVGTHAHALVADPSGARFYAVKPDGSAVVVADGQQNVVLGSIPV